MRKLLLVLTVGLLFASPLQAQLFSVQAVVADGKVITPVELEDFYAIDTVIGKEIRPVYQDGYYIFYDYLRSSLKFRYSYGGVAYNRKVSALRTTESCGDCSFLLSVTGWEKVKDKTVEQSLLALHSVAPKPSAPDSTYKPPYGTRVCIDTQPKAINMQELNSRINYSDYAVRNGIEGKVIWAALVSPSGKLINIHLLESNDQTLVDLSAPQMKYLRFTPASLHGVPLYSWVIIPIRFSLR